MGKEWFPIRPNISKEVKETCYFKEFLTNVHHFCNYLEK